MKSVDLDALVNPARQVGVSLGGKQYLVKPIGNAAAHRIAVANENGDAVAVLEAMTASARESCPTLVADPAVNFDELPLEAIAAIVAVSQKGVEAVERLIAERSAGKE